MSGSVGKRSYASRIAGIVVAAMTAAACSGGGTSSPPTSGGVSTTGATSTGSTGGPSSATPSATRLSLSLSKGTSSAAPATPTAVADGTPLDPARVQEILSRLEPLEGGAGEQSPFNWPTETQPPPRAGTVVDSSFPPPGDQAPPAADNGPLQVLRFQPEGDVAIAPFVTITFNQPMVPVGTLGQLAAAEVPATIEPAVEGTWQWIGTRTLRFDSAAGYDRMPMATTYTVTVPAGAASASGASLAEAATFTFTTPAPTVTAFVPSDTDQLPLTPVWVATFDQRVDPAAVLATVSVTADGDPVALRLATDDEIAADETAASAVSVAEAGRFVAFRPVDPMPTDARVVVDIGPGTPSAEGPATTTEADSHHDRTYAALKVTESGCGGPCQPGGGFSITLNNNLDADAFDPAAVRVSPALPGISVGVYGNVVQINGVTAGNTTYTVTLPAALTDVFGQTLGTDQDVSIDVGTADPWLRQLELPLVTLDPLTDGRTMSINSVNHDRLRVRIYRVTPDDWPAFATYWSQEFQAGNGLAKLPAWDQVSDDTIEITGTADQNAETALDLSKALGGKPGHLVVVVEPTETYDQNDPLYWQNRPTIAWVQSTSIGLDGLTDYRKGVVWATDLRTGAPLAGLQLSLGGAAGAGPLTTDDQGLASFDLTSSGVSVITATQGDDTAILPAGYYGESWAKGQFDDQSRWMVFTDRGIYRPGETASVKGWVRRFTASTDSQIAAVGGSPGLNYTVFDPQGNQIGSGTAEVSSLGGFDFAVEIPESANLGYATLQLDLTGVTDLPYASTSTNLQIEEFRRPEFEVNAHNDSAGPIVSTNPATVAVDATYYAGGPLGAAPVEWTVSTSDASYAPPGWDRFTFGVWTPWWLSGPMYGGYAGMGYRSEMPVDCCFPGQQTDVKTFQGTTDASGSDYLQIDFAGADGDLPDLPKAVSAQAAVTDVNRQQWSSTANLIVHPSQYYVGLRSDRTFVKQGDPFEIQAIVTDIDGNVVIGRPLTLTANRSQPAFEGGRWIDKVVSSESCEITSAADPVSCTFDSSQGGTYTVTTTVADDNGGRNRTELTRWVSGGGEAPSRVVQQESLTIVPDRQTYAPGDMAELLVVSPFAAGEGLLTISHDRMVDQIRFTVAGGSAVVELPIDAAWVPNVNLSAEVVGTAPRLGDDGKPLDGAPARPAFAVGAIDLSVPPVAKTLDVTATPKDSEVGPGGSTSIDVTVKDAAGAAVPGAEFSVVVVDEAVLALSGFATPNPLDAFYSPLYSQMMAQYGRSSIVLASPERFAADQAARDSSGGMPAATEAPAAMEAAATTMAAPLGAAPRMENAKSASDAFSVGAGAGAPTTPIDTRSNFDALALFQPEVTTDADGHATIDVTLPDNLTRYRVMVVAADGADRFDRCGRTPGQQQVRPQRSGFGHQLAYPLFVLCRVAHGKAHRQMLFAEIVLKPLACLFAAAVQQHVDVRHALLRCARQRQQQ